jgi:hypothetical protein
MPNNAADDNLESRLVKALGLPNVQSLKISLATNSVAAVEVVHYDWDKCGEALITELEARQYVLISREEYDRLNRGPFYGLSPE